MSATIEGGNYRCPHGIDTDSVDEWNKHCSDPENGHTESGTTVCVSCGDPMIFINHPFFPIDAKGSKNVSLRCEECNEKFYSLLKNNQIMKVNKRKGVTIPEPLQQQQQQNVSNTEDDESE